MYKFDADATDKELLETIEEWVAESKPYHEELKKAYDKGLQYYKGDQTDKSEIPTYLSDSVYNRIFEGVETLVPIVTGSSHQFIAYGDDESPKSKERAKKLQQALTKKFEDLHMKGKLAAVARAFMLGRYGVLEWGWDYEKDDVGVWYVDPRFVLIPKLHNDPNDSPYVIKLQEFTPSEFSMFFPDEDVEDYEGTTSSLAEKKGKGIIHVLNTWTNEYVTWTTDDKVLKKMPNPYFDFKGESEIEKGTDDNKVKVKTYKKKRNHLDTPTKPFVFFAPFRTGEAPFAEASMTEISIPIQDDINTQKRQITNNIIAMGNGQVYMDSDVMDEEKAQSITNEPGAIIVGKNLVSENRISRDAGTPLPQSHFANLQASLSAFDNVFGVHASVRGNSDSETLGGQIMNQQRALSRIDQLSTVINDGIARVADGATQMFKMFYTEKHIIRTVGEEGKVEMIEFTRQDVEDGVVVETKSGVPISLDPQGKYNQAIQLWQLQAIDPESLYERLDFPNPQLTSQKLAGWRAGQLVLEEQIRGQAEAQKAEQERDVETPNDATQRATEAATGGGKAPLTNTPNQ